MGLPKSGRAQRQGVHVCDGRARVHAVHAKMPDTKFSRAIASVEVTLGSSTNIHLFLAAKNQPQLTFDHNYFYATRFMFDCKLRLIFMFDFDLCLIASRVLCNRAQV